MLCCAPEPVRARDSVDSFSPKACGFMEFLLGLLCVLGVVTVVGHALWVTLAWFFRLGLPVEQPKAEPQQPHWTCHGCGVTNTPLLRDCRNCRLDRTSPLAGTLSELAVAAKQLRELRSEDPVHRGEFDQVLDRVEARRKKTLEGIGGLYLEIPPRPDVAVAVAPVVPAWQLLERTLADTPDPRNLSDDDRRQALEQFRSLADGQWRRLSDRALLSLARLLDNASQAAEVIYVYRALLERCPHETAFAEAALEAGCIAVQQEKWEQARWFLERVEHNDPLPATLHQARELLRLCQTHLPAPTPAPSPEKTAALAPPEVIPPPPPAPPRRSLTEVLAAFMEERNIVWGELLGGMLMVGCSIALVISLWKTLEQIPYFPFLIFAALTATLYSVGLYTLYHWKLESTSRGLLVIATLLVPLNLLVLARLSQRGGRIVETGHRGGFVSVVYLVGLSLRACWSDGCTALTLADS